jgi:solute carrier family 25 (mitochondrial carnitine/acylcarnitine transporter), member 20/29
MRVCKLVFRPPPTHPAHTHQGFGITLARDVPSFAVYFVVYEALCREFRVGSDPHHLSARDFGLLNIAGGVAGVFAWGCIYPIDVLKSCYQTQPLTKPATYKQCYRMLRATGWGTFTLGLGATLARAFPINAATFSVYELCLHYLDKWAGIP